MVRLSLVGRVMAAAAVAMMLCTEPVAAGAVSNQLHAYDPVADPKAVTVSKDGLARFTVLTPTLVRCERAPFSDNATVAFVQRRTSVPEFTAETDPVTGALKVQTRAVTITYTPAPSAADARTSGPFTSASLSAELRVTPFSRWTPADPHAGSLLGTVRSLDTIEGPVPLNCSAAGKITVHGEGLHCAWGLLSRTGIAAVYDTEGLALDEAAGGYPVPRAPTGDDVYLFAHGIADAEEDTADGRRADGSFRTGYGAALADYALVGGRVPIPPRALHGAIFSRWFDLTGPEIREHVEGFSSRSLPLDVYVIDMDWHTGIHKGAVHMDWDGYSLAEDKFPTREIGHWLASRGLSAGVNLHDASGVAEWEDEYEAMKSAVGFTGTGAVPFQITDPKWAFALQDTVMRRIHEDWALPLDWIDWQQGGTQGGATGGTYNPTILLNHLRSTDNFRRGSDRRSQMLARWGGWGNHRYQLGFSGDVTHTWSSLAFQPYFTATAANALFGFWSHDIIAAGGDHELQTRWIQFGALASPVFRQHDAGAAAGGCADASPPNCAIVTSWGVPTENFEINRRAIQDRLRRVPYMYTLSRRLYDTGVSPVRPAYYRWPSLDDAYASLTAASNRTTVMIGDDLAASPVTAPADAKSNLATWTRWVPPGTWFDVDTGLALEGPAFVTAAHHLSEVPTLARAGSAVPGAAVDVSRPLGRARENPEVLTFDCAPPAAGAGDGIRGSVYEDDGDSTAYASGAGAGAASHAWTHLDHSDTGSRLTAEIRVEGTAPDATYPFLPELRGYEIRFALAGAPSAVTVDGTAVRFCRFGPPSSGAASSGPSAAPKESCWRWDARSVSLVVHLSAAAHGSSRTVEATYPDGVAPRNPLLRGVRGALRRARLAKAELDADRTLSSARDALTVFSASGDVLESAAGRASEDSGAAFSAALSALRGVFSEAAAEVAAEKGNTQRLTRASALLSTYAAEWGKQDRASTAAGSGAVPHRRISGVKATSRSIRTV